MRYHLCHRGEKKYTQTKVSLYPVSKYYKQVISAYMVSIDTGCIYI